MYGNKVGRFVTHHREEDTMDGMWKKSAIALAAIMAWALPAGAWAQVGLDPYETVERISDTNAKSIDALAALYAEVENEFAALQADYARCQSLAGNEQSLCLAKYDQDLGEALTRVKGKRGTVIKDLQEGFKGAVNDKDLYFETPGNTEAFLQALLEENPDDAGLMVAEQVLDAQDLYNYTQSFFGEVMRKLYALQKARVQKMKIAISDIRVPEVPDPGEAQARVDQGRKQRWQGIMTRIKGGRTGGTGGGSATGSGLKLPGDE